MISHPYWKLVESPMLIKHNIKLSQILFLVLSISIASPSSAKNAEQTGREIIQEVSDRDEGFIDMTSDVLMILKSPNGDEYTRNLKVKSLEVKNDGEKRLFSFLRPKDIKGTTILNHGHILEDDYQWIYLPAFKRVKRISSANKSGAFVSSEFAYEDLTSIEVDKYRHIYLGDTKLSDLDCFKVELVPAYKNSGYTRLVAYIDKKEYLFRQVEFYDLNNELLKTLVLNAYQQYKSRYWRPDQTIMTNYQTGKVTIMQWENIHIQTGLSKSGFNRNALKRYR